MCVYVAASNEIVSWSYTLAYGIRTGLTWLIWWLKRRSMPRLRAFCHWQLSSSYSKCVWWVGHDNNRGWET